MPGLHCVLWNDPSSTEAVKRAFLNSQKFMKHYEGYETSVLVDTEAVTIGYSGYSHYPLRHIKLDGVDILIDGNIYNLSKPDVEALLLSISVDNSHVKEGVFDFINKAEGEFIVMVYNHAEGSLLIFNDALGRLPAYVYHSRGMVVFSQEIKFIVPHLDAVSFSRDALAEYLMFRCPLEERTLLNCISRFPPASMLYIHPREDITTTEQIMSWNLDSEKENSVDIHSNATRLLPVFLESIQHISEFSKNKTALMSLSGGYDSRTVLSGFAQTSTKPIAFTFVNDTYRREVPQAELVSRILGIKHEVLSVLNPEEYSSEQLRRLVHLRDGLNSVENYPSLAFLEILRGRFESDIIMFTGEGGDKTLAPLGYNFGIRNLKQLAEYIYLTNRCFSINEVSRLFDLDPTKITHRLEAILDSYPESTLEGKFRHFTIFERAFKWLFEGESRDRSVFWQTTPFYSLSFFVQSIRLPEQVKRDRLFYRMFLTLLNRECAEVTLLRPRVASLASRLSLELPVPLIAFLSNYRHILGRNKVTKSYFFDAATEIVNRSTLIRDYFNLDYLREILRREISPRKLFPLLTILIYMDIVEGNASVSSS